MDSKERTIILNLNFRLRLKVLSSSLSASPYDLKYNGTDFGLIQNRGTRVVDFFFFFFPLSCRAICQPDRKADFAVKTLGKTMECSSKVNPTSLFLSLNSDQYLLQKVKEETDFLMDLNHWGVFASVGFESLICRFTTIYFDHFKTCFI